MAETGRIKGKVAVVTGGASGMGAATVRLFVREGARVVIADMQDRLGERLAGELGPACEFMHTDVSNETQVEALFQGVMQRHRRLDILVAGAGVENAKMEVDTSEAEWDHVLAVNAKGVFLCSKHAIPAMKTSGGGSIVNISSAFGNVGSPGFAAYHASKGAVRNFTKATAIAHAGEGIRANSIHPGAIDTPMLRAIFARMPDPQAAEAAFAAQAPFNRLGKPEDIAFGALYLASDEAVFVTGSELVIDGGLLAR